MPERFKSPEPPSRAGPVQSPELEPVPRNDGEQNGTADKGVANGAVADEDHPATDAADEQGLTRRKVVKVVRRVVKKVLPSEKTEASAQEAAAPSSASRSAASLFSFKHDSIRTEDDMSQGLTSLMVRGRTREPRPRLRRDERPEKLELEKIKDNKDAKPEPEPEEKKTGGQRPESGTQEVPPKSRTASLPTVVGFIPPPKPTTMLPPTGFIPKPTNKKPSPSPVPQKPGSASLSPRPVQTPPPSKPGPLAPAPGAVPARKEVECPRRRKSMFTLIRRQESLHLTKLRGFKYFDPHRHEA